MDNLLRNIQHEKCPVCGKGKVFESKGNVLLLKIPKIKENCAQCGHKFEKEPGYFTGAMYVSYGLSLAELAVTFIILRLASVPIENMIYFLVLIIVALTSFNFRMSRIIWMHLT